MGVCQKCGLSFDDNAIRDGICLNCKPWYIICKSCGKETNVKNTRNGVCGVCKPFYEGSSNEYVMTEDERIEKEKYIKLLEDKRIQNEAKLRIWESKNDYLLNTIIISTETTINLNVTKRLGVITSQRIYGINIIKDFFAFVRDIVGGRINSLEISLNEANNEIIEDLKKQAFLLDGNYIIAVNLSHTYNNSNNGSILSVLGIGTVLKVEKD